MKNAFVIEVLAVSPAMEHLLPLYSLDEVSGQLILTNLSRASAGTYRCVATNQMGSASCELTLSVTGRDAGLRPGGQARATGAAGGDLRGHGGLHAALRLPVCP